MDTRLNLEFDASEIIGSEVMPRLTLSEAAPFRLTCKNLYSIFKTRCDATKLLELVRNANWHDANLLATANPDLMFQHVNIISLDNGTCEYISPLKCAVKNCDTRMLRLFEVIARQTQDKNMIRAFNKQMIMQSCEGTKIAKIAFDNVCNNLPIKQVQFHNREITEDDYFVEWIKFGKAQRDYLPKHILNEFCRKVSNLELLTKLDSLPDLVENVADLLESNELGVSMILARDIYKGGVLGAKLVSSPFHIYYSYENDITIINSIYQKRVADMAARIIKAETELKSEENTSQSSPSLASSSK